MAAISKTVEFARRTWARVQPSTAWLKPCSEALAPVLSAWEQPWALVSGGAYVLVIMLVTALLAYQDAKASVGEE